MFVFSIEMFGSDWSIFACAMPVIKKIRCFIVRHELPIGHLNVQMMGTGRRLTSGCGGQPVESSAPVWTEFYCCYFVNVFALGQIKLVH